MDLLHRMHIILLITRIIWIKDRLGHSTSAFNLGILSLVNRPFKLKNPQYVVYFVHYPPSYFNNAQPVFELRSLHFNMTRVLDTLDHSTIGIGTWIALIISKILILDNPPSKCTKLAKIL